MDADDRAPSHAVPPGPSPVLSEADAAAPGPRDWPAQRRQAVAGHAAALAADRAAEAAKAGALLADFVRQAARTGLAPHPLRAISFDGHSTFRTTLQGWYLKSNRSVAVGSDGGYYILTVPSSLRARFTGASVAPSTPRLVVGAGGGDGETVSLAQLLERRLTAGALWP
ncbi:hypothetical protein [Actinoplanes sp. TFC3]|uniref:hypothetical protein n=1 Tax=Actinoplanes sp. TFC3 TaxID=1710355 RepID=UPI000AC01679|nr:hypothetical protein [Actinoplanes sp. TFC3]